MPAFVALAPTSGSSSSGNNSSSSSHIGGGGGSTFRSNVTEATASAAGILLQVHEAIHWHGYVNPNREALYGFMQEAFDYAPSGLGSKELYNITQTKYSPTLGYNENIMPQPPYFSFEQLQTTSTGNVLSATELNGGNGSRSVHDVVLDVTSSNVKHLAERRKAAAVAAATSTTTFVTYIREHAARAVGLILPNTTASKVVAVNVADLKLKPAVSFRSVIINGEGRCKIEIELFYPPATTTPAKGALIFLVQPDPGHASKTMLNSEQSSHVLYLASRGYVVAGA